MEFKPITMSTQFLTNLTEEEFREFLRQTLREILREETRTVSPLLPEIMDVQQAAHFLNLKVNTLYEKTSRKQIPHFKKGNKLYFDLSELQEWIKQGKVKTLSEVQDEAINYSLKKKAA